MDTEKTKEEVSKTHYNHILTVVNVLLMDGAKTDIDSQIKAIETLNDSLINTPLFHSIISSLKEMRGIKRNNNR